MNAGLIEPEQYNAVWEIMKPPQVDVAVMQQRLDREGRNGTANKRRYVADAQNSAEQPQPPQQGRHTNRRPKSNANNKDNAAGQGNTPPMAARSIDTKKGVKVTRRRRANGLVPFGTAASALARTTEGDEGRQ